MLVLQKILQSTIPLQMKKMRIIIIEEVTRMPRRLLSKIMLILHLYLGLKKIQK